MYEGLEEAGGDDVFGLVAVQFYLFSGAGGRWMGGHVVLGGVGTGMLQCGGGCKRESD